MKRRSRNRTDMEIERKKIKAEYNIIREKWSAGHSDAGAYRKLCQLRRSIRKIDRDLENLRLNKI